MTELSPGRILASRFELRRLLGRGGMGQVWLAVDSELGEQVAVKVLEPALATDEAMLALLHQDDLDADVAMARRWRGRHDEVLLVLDATAGQNGIAQAKQFKETAGVTGIVLSKLDGTAKGGVLVALADRFGLPIHAIGVGEQIDDLAPFDPQDFARALTGADA